MGIWTWTIIGIVVSVLTLIIEPYIIQRHIIITIILGVLGAIIGGEIGSFLGFDEIKGMHFMVIVLSLGVSAFVLTWYRAFEKFYE